MDLATELGKLHKRAVEHREALLNEEAAKTALVMPFLQALGYNIFDPTEVAPEFCADVGTKKGEKVDYAICKDGKVNILVECKPASVELNINHASQLFRYFSVTEARLAILTNGVVYKFFSDVEKPNKMDDKPFFTFSMDSVRPSDIKVIESFSKSEFNVDQIIKEAGNLKVQSLLRKELEREFAEPSEEFVRMMASRVHDGRVTTAVKENLRKLLVGSISSFVRDMVNERLSSALNATGAESETQDQSVDIADMGIATTQEEISAFHIVQAIASRHIDPKRVVMRDAKSYCAVLLDDNNRRTLVRLHFNGITAKYLGTFKAKDEQRHLLDDLTDIYKFEKQISARIAELESAKATG